jgi:D-glycero-D-manno-heptose 1,7-bisphosphate phosphatase
VNSQSGAAGRPAVFLDRDGTIIEDLSYLHDPAQVRLLPGAAQAIKRLNERNILAIVVTNQSGIARGLLSQAEYRAGERRLDSLLQHEGARIDAHYFCPHLPEVSGPCDCRKPGVLLYRQAAERFGIDLGQSWWVGDRERDVAPAAAFKARGFLVLSGAGQDEGPAASAKGFELVPDLSQAVDLILNELELGARSQELPANS